MFCTSQRISQKLHYNLGGMILGIETSLPSFLANEGEDSLLHIMSLLMQRRGGSVIIVLFSCFFFVNLDCRKNKYLIYNSEIQTDLIVLRNPCPNFMNEWLKYALF